MKTVQNRREFLAMSAGAVGAAMTAGTRAQAGSVATPGVVPSNTIIDTHTHFYDPTRPQGVPWPTKDDSVLYRRVLPADYRALPKPRPVTATVVVEASSWLEDNQWILDLAVKNPFIVGFVGHLNPGEAAFQPNIKRFAANPLFRGIRIGSDRLRKGAASGQTFLEDMKLLAGQDLALDLLGGPDMLPDVPRFAEAVPDLRIIIDHVANLRIDGKAAETAWQKGMEAAARHPNVYCKVSGLVEGTGRAGGNAPADVEYYRPVLDAIWQVFGPDRLVYGSNWPVSERFAPCATVQQLVQDYFGGKGEAALEKVFWRNSKAFYKWIQRA
jgi:L-fuconolactonase